MGVCACVCFYINVFGMRAPGACCIAPFVFMFFFFLFEKLLLLLLTVVIMHFGCFGHKQNVHHNNNNKEENVHTAACCYKYVHIYSCAHKRAAYGWIEFYRCIYNIYVADILLYYIWICYIISIFIIYLGTYIYSRGHEPRQCTSPWPQTSKSTMYIGILVYALCIKYEYYTEMCRSWKQNVRENSTFVEYLCKMTENILISTTTWKLYSKLHNGKCLSAEYFYLYLYVMTIFVHCALLL